MSCKDYLRCPECGSDLSEVGVVELRGFFCYPDGIGAIDFEETNYHQCDDVEDYICAKCNAKLEWEMGDGAGYIG